MWASCHSLYLNPSIITWARLLSLARSELRLCSANHRAGYFSNLTCDWLSIVWAYSEQETENGPWPDQLLTGTIMPSTLQTLILMMGSSWCPIMMTSQHGNAFHITCPFVSGIRVQVSLVNFPHKGPVMWSYVFFVWNQNRWLTRHGAQVMSLHYFEGDVF